MIDKILNAKNISECFLDMAHWRDEYIEMAQAVHPDVCKDPRANDAMTRLNEFKKQLEDGRISTDDAGKYVCWPDRVKFEGDPDLIAKSFKLMSAMANRSEGVGSFRKYFPKSFHDASLELADRAIPLSSLGRLEQVHVNWIFSRILEFVAWINMEGYCHGGINPDSIFVVPKTHGIIVASFYHCTNLGQKMDTVSGKYSQFYPDEIFVDKTATPEIDLTLAKATAVYLLGDKSGIGDALRRDPKAHQEFLDFLRAPGDPKDYYGQYRKWLEKHFERKFIPFNA